MKAFPTYRGFTMFLYHCQKKKKLIPTWKKIIYYFLGLIVISILWVMLGIFICMLKSSLGSSREVKYPSKRYRKVIKEGILWDSIEYHER